jgi:hypothetical protein
MLSSATVEQLINEEQYFVIRAARQSGKTTYLKDLANRLNVEGKYYALYCSLEGLQEITDPARGIPETVKALKSKIEETDIPHSTEFAEDADYENFTGVLKTSLTRFCKLLDKPLVILFDEADCLREGTLISFLRQLRDGYNSRPEQAFPHSIAFVGTRSIRNRQAYHFSESESFTGLTLFNNITDVLTIPNFTKEEIIRLYRQHTDATGQLFKADAIEQVWEQTQGQPWLVNAIAREVIDEMLQSDYTRPVTAELVHQAIQAIILNRPTHIDSLLERLKEERVRKVIEPMILGDEFISKESDDFQYAKDLGLIRVGSDTLIRPANPIYAEVIIRRLSSEAQEALLNPKYPYQISRYLKNGRLDINYLMSDFQQFWRTNSNIWIEKSDYREAAPHLMLTAFLQRIVHSGGQVISEMASGTGCLDLCLLYEDRKYPIELRIRYGNKYLEEGLEQTARHMYHHNSNEGWLVIFDRRPSVSWKKKIYLRKETVNGKTITIVGA